MPQLPHSRYQCRSPWHKPQLSGPIGKGSQWSGSGAPGRTCLARSIGDLNVKSILGRGRPLLSGYLAELIGELSHGVGDNFFVKGILHRWRYSCKNFHIHSTSVGEQTSPAIGCRGFQVGEQSHKARWPHTSYRHFTIFPIPTHQRTSSCHTGPIWAVSIVAINTSPWGIDIRRWGEKKAVMVVL
jgi:hypothetical protein